MESSEIKGLKEMGSPKINIPDHHNLHLHHHHHINCTKTENGVSKSDTFVVDVNNFSNGGDRDSPTSATNTINPRITLQRSLTKKLSQRGMERKANINGDSLTPSSSPRAGQVVSMPENPLSPSSLQVGSIDHPKINQSQHQITIKTGGVSSITADGKWTNNRSSFKRSPPSWFSDPKRILLLFATLSCMGTMLLIFFTLSMKNPIEKDNVLDWQ